MITARSALWRLTVAIVVAATLLIVVSNAITQPVAVEQQPYSADFSDASGLHTGADVRLRGVPVGKVTSIQLRRESGQSLATVGFTLDRRYSIGPQARLAVKFQALTGLRYLDVAKVDEHAADASTIRHVPMAMTQPSFDVTELFNGLQPVLATLSPEQVNTFTANVASFLDGDGTGLGPVLASLHTLTDFLADREQVVAALMHNLAAVADEVGGRSKELIQILEWLNRPIDGAIAVLDEYRKSQVYGPEFTSSVVQLLNNTGFRPGVDVNDAIDRAYMNVDNTIEAFKLIPVMWENVPAPPAAGQPEPCSRGRAELPLPVEVLLNGQRIELCQQ